MILYKNSQTLSLKSSVTFQIFFFTKMLHTDSGGTAPRCFIPHRKCCIALCWGEQRALSTMPAECWQCDCHKKDLWPCWSAIPLPHSHLINTANVLTLCWAAVCDLGKRSGAMRWCCVPTEEKIVNLLNIFPQRNDSIMRMNETIVDMNGGIQRSTSLAVGISKEKKQARSIVFIAIFKKKRQIKMWKKCSWDLLNQDLTLNGIWKNSAISAC